jgi:hypothetical protein
MEKIVVWAGPLTIVDIIDCPLHTSPKVVLDRLMPDLRDTFGLGVQLKRVNEYKYEVDVSKVATR